MISYLPCFHCIFYTSFIITVLPMHKRKMLDWYKLQIWTTSDIVLPVYTHTRTHKHNILPIYRTYWPTQVAAKISIMVNYLQMHERKTLLNHRKPPKKERIYILEFTNKACSRQTIDWRGKLREKRSPIQPKIQQL